jgi:hypothetical protein
VVGLVVVLAVVSWLLWRNTAARSEKERAHATKVTTAGTTATSVKSSAASRSPIAPAAPTASDAVKIPDRRAELEKARAIANPRERAQAFGTLLQRWVEDDLEGALAYLRGLPRNAEFSLGLRLALNAVAVIDVERALRLAGELAATRDDQIFYSEIFNRMARENALAAAQRLALVPPGRGRENAIRALADAWTRNDAAAALVWARGLRDEADRIPAMDTIIRELTERDPSRAIELAQSSLSGAARERSMFDALRKLAVNDPREAAGLVHLLPAGEMQTLLATDVAHLLARDDVRFAMTWVQTLPSGAPQTLALNNVLVAWTRADRPAAASYVANLPPGPLQHSAAVYLAGIWGEQPQAALTWSEQLPAATRPAVVTAIVSNWAQYEPEAATRWTAGLAASSMAPEALNAALSYWILKDAAAARDFVRTLAGEVQTLAATAIAPRLAQRDPAGTLAWAENLATPAARDAAHAAAFKRWRDNAPAAADAWLDTAALSPETKAKLRRL